jgi:hypothetical protein
MKSIAVALVILCSTAASAQINVTLTAGAPGAPAAASGVQAITTISSDTAINVTCSTGVDCNFVAVKIDTKTIPLSTGATARTGTIPFSMVSSSGSALHITSGTDGKEVSGGPFQLLRGAATANTDTDTDTTTTTGGDGKRVVPVQTICDRVRFEPAYSQSGNRAHIVVTVGGSIIQQPREMIDENDIVVVHVVDEDESRLRSIEVSRVSPTRTTGNLSLIGEGTTFTPQSRTTNVCYERQFELSNFAPGEGKVEIATVTNNQRTVTGTTTFTVDRLYDGILSLGPAWSHVVDESYGLAPNAAGQNVIVKTADGNSDIVYAVQYTQYMWGRRDVEKDYPLYQHFNPSIGFSMTNFKDHALAGVSFDWKQFLFTAGAHFARVTRLAEGTALGSTFTGAATAIPTEKEWQSGLYFAVTVDVRAAKALLTAIGR